MERYKISVFGRLPVEPRKLIEELNRKWCSKRPQTKEVFRHLARVGRSRGLTSKGATGKELKSYYRGGSKTRREFLIDFLWWDQGFGTVLAAESELSDRTIRGLKHDFEKLLCWKSPMKLMLARERRAYNAKKIATELSNYAKRNVRQVVKNECFVLFVFGISGSKNRAFIHCSSRDRSGEFRFREYSLATA